MAEIKEPTSPPAADFKEPIGGGKRDRTPCADGEHDWECKNSASGFKLDQMKTRVMQIAAKCFPEKRVVCATRGSERERLSGKLRQWQGKLGVTLPSMGV